MEIEKELQVDRRQKLHGIFFSASLLWRNGKLSFCFFGYMTVETLWGVKHFCSAYAIVYCKPEFIFFFVQAVFYPSTLLPMNIGGRNSIFDWFLKQIFCLLIHVNKTKYYVCASNAFAIRKNARNAFSSKSET